jgi:hypothetical protein
MLLLKKGVSGKLSIDRALWHLLLIWAELEEKGLFSVMRRGKRTRGRGCGRHGDTGTRGHGDAETRRHGDAETRRRGDTGTRRHGDAETRRRGDTGTGRREERADSTGFFPPSPRLRVPASPRPLLPNVRVPVSPRPLLPNVHVPASLCPSLNPIPSAKSRVYSLCCVANPSPGFVPCLDGLARR